MPGIDLLISGVLSLEIKKNLDPNILKNLEKELFFEHGMSIKLSMEHFDIFLKIIKNNLDIEIDGFEKNCIDKIIQVRKTKNNYNIKIIRFRSQRHRSHRTEPPSRAVHPQQHDESHRSIGVHGQHARCCLRLNAQERGFPPAA